MRMAQRKHIVLQRFQPAHNVIEVCFMSCVLNLTGRPYRSTLYLRCMLLTSLIYEVPSHLFENLRSIDTELGGTRARLYVRLMFFS